MAQTMLNRVLEEIQQLDSEDLLQVEQAIRVRLSPSDGSSPKLMPTAEEIMAANTLLRETIVTVNRATGVDNESIDTDLAREYGDDHATMYISAGRR